MKSDIRRLAEIVLDDGLNHSAAGRAAGKDRDTIRRMRRRAEEGGLQRSRLADVSDSALREMLIAPNSARSSSRLMPDWDAIVSHVTETGDPLTQAYDDLYLKQRLETEGMKYMSYAHFARLASKQLKQRAPEYRHNYRPGVVMQMDFAGFQPRYLSADGRMVSATLLLVNFPFSQYCEGEVIAGQSRLDVIHGIIRIFGRLGATPRRIVIDNFKAAIDKARTPSKPAKINPDFLAFLDFYDIIPDPARRGEPRDKGSMEGAVRLTQRYIRSQLRQFEAQSVGDLNRALQAALTRLNTQTTRRWKKSRLERFKLLEEGYLRRLPPTPYEYGTWLVGIKVPPHYHVLVENNEYSVPHRHIGSAVTLKLTATSVEIHGESGLLAVHVRRTDVRGERITDAAHMPPNHQIMRAQSPEGLLEQAATVGPNVIAFVERHLRDQQNLRGTSRFLKHLLTIVAVQGRDRIDAACAEAISRGQIDADAVHRLLKRNAASPVEPGLAPVKPLSGNVRGASYYAEDGNAV